MNSLRRSLLRGAALLPLAVTGEPAAVVRAADGDTEPGPLGQADFNLGGQTYINAASVHPLSIHAAAAMRKYVDARAGLISREHGEVDPRARFAQLINAKPEEVALVPNTTTGENYVIGSLGLRHSRDRIVTDELHFMGSLYMYDQLKKEGLDVKVVKPRNNVIDLDDAAACLDKRTRLIAVSLVSMTTGFKHDLKVLCELAHSHGAMVYADIIQAAGNIPLDVRESNLDFAACSTYKWLMGDFGVGFLYTREDHLQRMQRPVYGYQQVSFDAVKLPRDPRGGDQHDWVQKQGARGYFETGTQPYVVLAAVQSSLDRILATGVEEIARRRQPLIDFVRSQLPAHGFEPLAPPSNSALACFGYRDAEKILAPKLDKANISISVYEHRIRISPSVYNDMKDMERVVDVLTSRA